MTDNFSDPLPHEVEEVARQILEEWASVLPPAPEDFPGEYRDGPNETTSPGSGRILSDKNLDPTKTSEDGNPDDNWFNWWEDQL